MDLEIHAVQPFKATGLYIFKMIQSFDPSVKAHVEWLRKLFAAEMKDKVTILRENPMKKPVPDFDMIQIYFGLAAKYTKAIFDKTAVILD